MLIASVSAGSLTTGVEIPDPAVVGDEVLAWGWQLEQSSYATSYIPSNSGTSVTRTYDYFNGYFDEVTTQGTIFIDFEQLKQGGGDYRFRDPSNQNSYAFYYYGGGMDVYNGAAFMVDRSTLEPNNSKVAVSWNCLLYTSPSPRDGLLSRMPSSA